MIQEEQTMDCQKCNTEIAMRDDTPCGTDGGSSRRQWDAQAPWWRNPAASWHAQHRRLSTLTGRRNVGDLLDLRTTSSSPIIRAAFSLFHRPSTGDGPPYRGPRSPAPDSCKSHPMLAPSLINPTEKTR
jgi:hypothetical protein